MGRLAVPAVVVLTLGNRRLNWPQESVRKLLRQAGRPVYLPQDFGDKVVLSLVNPIERD